MEDAKKALVTKELRTEGLQLAHDYKYVNARDGQVRMTLLRGGQIESAYVVLHFARVQFQPATGGSMLDTVPRNSVLASVELSLGNAKALQTELQKLIAASKDDL
jgi:hypothetical protein